MDTVMELEIRPGAEPGSYIVQVLRSVGGGEPTSTMTLDLDDLAARRPLLEASVLSSSVSARRVMSEAESAIQEVGRRLFTSTFAGSVGAAYRTSLAVASERGSGVQVALRLTAPGLAALPWEAMFDAETGTYICRKEPLVRHVPAPYTPAALALDPPLRVLGMISSPRGLPPLDVGIERERLEEALRPHLDSGRVELEWLDDVTWSGVHGKLLEQEWHVLHFIGHGAYDTDTDEGVLAFVGADGRADNVPATALADLLDEAEPTPRLVVLNSCQSGAEGTLDLFSGTAAALAHSGIHAVAAMQYSISDGAAIAFARGFYTALAHGRGIDEAVRSGRIGILGIARGTLEWVTPVLYVRGEDTRLFDVAPLAQSATPPPAPPVTPPVTPPGEEEPGTVSAESHPEGPPAESSADGAPIDAPTNATPPADASDTPPTPPPPPTTDDDSDGRADPHPRPSHLRRWLVVGIASAVIIGGGITAALALQQRPTTGGDAPATTAPATVRADPVTVTVPIDGAQPWTPTGVQCATGATLEITTAGEGYHDFSETSLVGPDGLTDGQHPEARVYAGANTVALIGRLDQAPPYFSVGSGTVYTCPREGELSIGINDTIFNGNRGSYSATITTYPAE